MHVLLSNDDGVDAEGLRHLRECIMEARPEWRVTVVAPDREQSASSHALTLTQPLRVIERGDEIYAVTGTPTDCILVAMNAIVADDLPDVVISGINHGPNMGEDVHYSGTVAAAFEGRILGVPAVALSLASRHVPMDFSHARSFIKETLPTWLENGVADGKLLNVNIPGGEREAVEGVRVCRLGSRKYENAIVPKEDPRGRVYYWVAGHAHTIADQVDTDLVLSRDGWITVTPLRVDLTAERDLAELTGLDQAKS